jgi:AcrR family transcriptional regulator
MPTQAERRARTRAALLDAAGAVFAARGYHAATLDEITERAGVSKGSVYYNFASKHELFATLLGEHMQRRITDIAAALPASGSGADQARAAGTAFLTAITSDPRWAPLFFEFAAQAARDNSVRAAFTAWLADARAALAALISYRLEALGTASALEPERLATLVSALTNGMLLEHLFDPTAAPPELLGDGLALLTAPPA